MKKHFLGLFVIMILLFNNCDIHNPDNGSQNNPDNDNSSKKLSFIDITNAVALMVIPSNSMARSVQEQSIFVKQKSDGSLENINFLNEDGSSTNRVPSAIYNATNEYMIIIIDNVPYLVNKINGFAYDLTPIGKPEMLRANYGYNGYIRKSIYQDFKGNIYYLNGGIVKKINITNPLQITAENVTPDVYHISSVNVFSVDNDGNVLYSYDDNFIEHFRIKTVTGSIINIDEMKPGLNNGNQVNGLTFTGYDGFIYSSINGVLNKIVINGTSVSYTPISGINISELFMGGQGLTWIYLPDIIIVTNGYMAYELFNTNTSPNSYSINTSSPMKFITVGSQYYYIVNQNMEILKIDPVNKDTTILINSGIYDNIYNIVTTKNDITIINALRLSDSKKILCNILLDGSITILSENVSTNIIVLERVN